MTEDKLNKALEKVRKCFRDSKLDADQALFIMECIKIDIMEKCYRPQREKVKK